MGNYSGGACCCIWFFITSCGCVLEAGRSFSWECKGLVGSSMVDFVLDNGVGWSES